ncbi:hypothetical protein WJX72_003836 [[Myrmecia] bisecta]|uniref:Tyr recombinase domain-containing protein n=1 Tax=[Myrmecia] bisecta TaxID=41462 RepID=A0AAW1P4U8_9CHLO
MEGAVTQVLISRPGQAAVVVCRVRDTRDRVYFPMRQVHTLVLADSLTYQTYYRTLQGVSHGSIKAVSPGLRAQLAAKKALGPRAKTASVVSVATLLRALAKLGVSPVVIESFKAAQCGHLHHVAPEAAELIDDTVEPLPQQVPTDFPVVLPACNVPAAKLKARYGLKVTAPHLLKHAPLSTQLVKLREWSSHDVQLDRDGGRISSTTLKKVDDNINTYLGYLFTYQSDRCPTLEAYLDPYRFAGYISYLRAKKSGKGRLSSVISTTQRVVSFLEATGPLQPGALRPLTQWLQKLWKQLNLVTPKNRKDIVTLDQERRWIDAADFQRVVDKGCELEGCLGNRLFWATDELGVKTLKMDLPHHKNAAAWGGQAIAFTMPPPLTSLFKRYLKWGHKILTDYQGNEREQLVFVDKQGRPFSDATFCLYWQAWLESRAGVRVSPQVMRHVFVDGLRSTTDPPPIAERGAAMAMGNSVRTWDAAYDTRFAGRMAQTAIDGFGTWRAGLVLQRAPIITTSVPTASLGNPAPTTLHRAIVMFPSIPARHTPPTEMSDAATHQQQQLAKDDGDIVIDLTCE